MKLQLLLLTAFGLGYLKPAPGTWGSTPPVILAFALVLIGLAAWQVNVCVALLGLVFAIVCIRFGSDAERLFAAKDPSQVVADEVAGQAIVLLLLPWRAPGENHALLWNAALALTAFISFRLFDITKPPPAYQTQRVGGGWGILLDDLVAALYGVIAAQLFVRLMLPKLMPI